MVVVVMMRVKEHLVAGDKPPALTQDTSDPHQNKDTMTGNLLHDQIMGLWGVRMLHPMPCSLTHSEPVKVL